MTITDEEVARKVQKGDLNAYAEIVERYRMKLGRYLNRLGLNVNDSEDVLQDVFIKAYKNIQSFNIKMKFSSWIYRIAHNEAINLIKKSKRSSSLDIYSSELPSDDISIQEKLETIEGIKELEKCIGDLPLKYKEVLFLKYAEEKSYTEISDILRIPISTVGTLLHRGMKELRLICLKRKNERK